MHSKSGNYFPYGLPTFWYGNYIPMDARKENRYYFIRIKTSFKLKKGYLPFIQIKNSYVYKSNDMLETSDFVVDGKTYQNRVELTLTMTDFELIKEHYDLYNFEILDGCWFYAVKGIFDSYIDKYMDKKINAKSKSERSISKLFLNNLYGKFSVSPVNAFKVPILEDGIVKYKIVKSYDKDVSFIPVGSAITSYARRFTIIAAQKNYKNFIYADTDSIHIKRGIVKGIEIHPKNLCCWKHESSWDKAIFVRQKTYIEHIIEEDEQPIEDTYYNVKCAGMNERCKQLLIKSFGEDIEIKDLSADEKTFLEKKRSLKDFKKGLSVPGKLLPKIISGGTVLFDTTFKIR